MEAVEYVALNDSKNHWSGATAIWVLVAGVIILAIVHRWTNQEDKKTEMATAMATMAGKISCIEPRVEFLGLEAYNSKGIMGQNTRGLNDLYRRSEENFRDLNSAVFAPRCEPYPHGLFGAQPVVGGCGNNSRVFNQIAEYDLKDTTVTVTDTCPARA